MSIVRWLHLSDLHFGYNSYIAENMRNKLLLFIKEIVPINYLFVTGDLRYGKTEHIKYPKYTIEFINRLQCLLKIEGQSTFIVSGNHDINRSDGLEALIDSAKKEYRTSNGIISAETLAYIKKQRTPFLKLYKELCSRNEPSIHYSIETEYFNIININTSLMSVKDGEDGDLIVGTQLLREMMKTVNLSKPSIVLAHHPFDSLRLEEQRELEIILKDCNAILYLCGHKHIAISDNIKKYRQDRDLWLYACGTNMDTDPQLEVTDMDIFVGEIDTNNLCGYIQAYKWSRKNSAWIPDSEFSFSQNGALDGKQYFPTKARTVFSQINNKHILELYYRYIQYECGEIQLNGLPVDVEVGQRKLELEKLFVPLSFRESPFVGYGEIELPNILAEGKKTKTDERLFLDKIIPAEGSFHNFILASPGGGKTTLLKWIASVYCFPEKYKDKNTYLPSRKLFPIWVKCRDINYAIHPTILDIISDIAHRAELIADGNSVDNFVRLIHHYIENGTALLLIDGLDEISDDSERVNFINQVCRFINTNPFVNVIMTSRIAGFSAVINNNFDEFRRYEILDFNDSDIQKLCVDWYKIVVGKQEATIEKAKLLANIIIKHKNIKSLAGNPLMLTTLLLVERRVGRLPTKRVELYSEAIQVLLETWNLEAHESIDLDEARYQLAYVAYQMMIEHKQSVTKSKLVQMLKEARKELEGLIYSKDSYMDFIKKVERRSALLIQKGYSRDSESGKLEAIYEFQHLTFQEYLAAYAIAQRCYPRAQKNDDLSHVLEQHLKKEYMKEVVLLSATLLDRWSVDELVESLIKTLKNEDSSFREQHYLRLLLLHFVADEAPLQNRRKVYECCFNEGMHSKDVDVIRTILEGKYASEFVQCMERMDNSVSGWNYSSVIMALQNETLDAYKYYINNRKSLEPEHVVKALAVLDAVYWLKNEKIANLPNEEQRVNIKKELFAFAKSDNNGIQKQALNFLRLSGFLDNIYDFNRYFDLYVLNINRTNYIPAIADCIVDGMFVENCNQIMFTDDAAIAVRTKLTKMLLYTVTDYREWLTLFLVFIMYSVEEDLSFENLIIKRKKIILSNDALWDTLEKADKSFIRILENLIFSSTSISNKKKQSIQRCILDLNETWNLYKKERSEKILEQFENLDGGFNVNHFNRTHLSNADIDKMIEEIDRKLAELDQIELEMKKQEKDSK